MKFLFFWSLSLILVLAVNVKVEAAQEEHLQLDLLLKTPHTLTSQKVDVALGRSTHLIQQDKSAGAIYSIGVTPIPFVGKSNPDNPTYELKVRISEYRKGKNRVIATPRVTLFNGQSALINGQSSKNSWVELTVTARR